MEAYLNELRLVDSHLPWLFPVFVFGFGACVGSFLNVCIYRIPVNKSVVTPGSHCACGKPIAFYDNIPILTWLLLRGKARCCGQSFSFRYPAIEFLTAVLFLVCWLVYSPVVAFCAMLFCALMICATFIDIDHMIIPDRFSIGGGIVGVLIAFCVPALHGETSGWLYSGNFRSGITALCGFLIGSAVVVWIMILGEIAFKKEAMGFGDVKLMGAIGAFCGWQGAIFSIFAGSMLGLLAIFSFRGARLILGSKREETGEKPVAPERDESDGATLYLDVAYEKPPGGVPNHEIVVSSDQPFWKPETMALSEEVTMDEDAGSGSGKVKVRLKAQVVEESDEALGHIPFGPMLAAGALLYFLFLREEVNQMFAASAEIWSGG